MLGHAPCGNNSSDSHNILEQKPIPDPPTLANFGISGFLRLGVGLGIELERYVPGSGCAPGLANLGRGHAFVGWSCFAVRDIPTRAAGTWPVVEPFEGPRPAGWHLVCYRPASLVVRRQTLGTDA